MRSSKGFTLAEMAIAFVIIAILLVGAIIPLRTQIDVRNTADTQRTMDSVKDAVIGFALANGRLPCPADGSVPDGTAGAGTEQVSGNFCTVQFGVVPWATLGVPETDAWGRRFTYRVAPIFADAFAANTSSTATTTTPASPDNQVPTCSPTPVPTQPTSFALCSLGDLVVLTRSDSTHKPTALGSGLPAVIVSHGKNGYGAWQTNGTAIAAPAAGTDEAANAGDGGTATNVNATLAYNQIPFYSRTPTPGAAGCSDTAAGSFCEFDDLVAMISAPTLMARMVSAGKLP